MRTEGPAGGDKQLHINIASIKKNGKTFEIDIDPDLALDYKNGKDVDMRDILKVQRIYHDVHRAMEAPKKDILEAFETEDVLEAAGIIIKKGDVQLSNKHRKEAIEEKKRQIIGIIHRFGVDPHTHLPHPATRIENAFEEAKIHVDGNKEVNIQVQECLKKLRIIMPIRFEMKELSVALQSDYASKAYSVIKNSAKILRDEWAPDGTRVLFVEIPGGLEQEFYEKIEKTTHGTTLCRVIKTY